MNLALAGNLERGNLRLDANFEVRLERLLAQPPRLILWDLSRADLDLPGKDRLEGLVQSRYREVLRLDGRITPFAIPELKDGGSGHMIPFTRPWTMSRPGAPLVLYERVD